MEAKHVKGTLKRKKYVIKDHASANLLSGVIGVDVWPLKMDVVMEKSLEQGHKYSLALNAKLGQRIS